jgi:DHA1 family inner membrane transport protein
MSTNKLVIGLMLPEEAEATSMSLAVLALAVAAFGIGLAEFIIQGLLPEISADFSVSIPTAGLLVTGYALSVAVGGPVVVILLNRLDRRAALLALMGLFTIGNVLCAVAPSFGLLMSARIITSLCQGSFFGIAAVVAASIVAEDRRASAVSLMFSGLTVANILGVPSGTALGHAAGWRWTFWAVAFIGVVGIAGIAAFQPRMADTGRTGVVRELWVVRERQVLIGLLVGALITTAVFLFLTYIAPFVIEVTGVSAQAVPWMLVAFGLGGTVGMFAGGRLADWKRVPTLIVTLAFLILVYVAIFLGERSSGLTWISIFLVGSGIATVPPLQMIVVTAAREAPSLASTLLQSAFNIGISAGSLIGGTALSLGLEYRYLPLLSVVVLIVALGVARFPLVWAIRGAAARPSGT